MKTPFGSIVRRSVLSAMLVTAFATTSIAQQPASDAIHLDALPAGSVVSLGSGIQSVSSPQVLYTKQPVVKVPKVFREVVVAVNESVETSDNVVAAVSSEPVVSNNPLAQRGRSQVQFTQFSADAVQPATKEVGQPPAPRGKDSREQAHADGGRDDDRARPPRDGFRGGQRPRVDGPRAGQRGPRPQGGRERVGGMGPGGPGPSRDGGDHRPDHERHAPPPHPAAQHPRSIDAILESPAVKHILQLTTENIELKAELKIQKIEAEAALEILEMKAAKQQLEFELSQAKQARADARVQLAEAKEKIAELEQKLNDDDEDESDDDDDEDEDQDKNSDDDEDKESDDDDEDEDD